MFLEKEMCTCNGTEIGILLLKVIGDSRLRGNFNEESNENKYAIYLPKIETYLKNEEDYMPVYDKGTNTTYIPVNYFFTLLVNGDYLVYEILSAQDEQEFTLYQNKLFKEVLDDLFKSVMLFSKETLKNLVYTFEDKLKTLDKNSDTYLKDFSNTYALMYEILELTKTGMIQFPLKYKDMLCDIRYNKEFFKLNEKSLIKNMENFDIIINKAIESNDESLKVIPQKLDIEEINKVIDKSLYRLVKYCYF